MHLDYYSNTQLILHTIKTFLTNAIKDNKQLSYAQYILLKKNERRFITNLDIDQFLYLFKCLQPITINNKRIN